MEDVATLTADTDADLCARVRAGDSGAFELIYRRHVDWALGFAAGMLGAEEADDLVSETFAALLTTLLRGHGPQGPVRGYLRTALRHQAHRRLKPTDHEFVLGDMASVMDVSDRLVVPAVENSIVEQEDQARASRAFQALRPADRDILELVDIHGLSYKQAAQELGLRTTTVSHLVANARAALFDRWVAEHLPDPEEGHPSSLELARYRTGSARVRLRQRVEKHLARCTPCELRLASLDIERKRRRRRAAGLGPWALLPVWWGLSRQRPGWSRRLWELLTSRRTHVSFGMGLTMVAAAIVGLVVAFPGYPTGADAKVSAHGGESISASDASAAATTITVSWQPGASVSDAQVGDEVALGFRVRATGISADGATLTVTAPPGLSIDSRYENCTYAASTLTCTGIGPFDDGEELIGEVVVRVDQAGVTSLPTISVTR
ncbi:sigma-70 family RNA polymerase sigma factor [Cellulomonas sp. NPDC089187]|uniref:RNA polymerase sigma factor n=1 Tax=Cellulomonas sp. NPDC089187 TaxID=3154970 RepID=UPI00341234F2